MQEIKTYTLEELNNGKAQYTEVGLTCKNQKILSEVNAGVLIDEYILKNDRRFLIPIVVNGKVGLINHLAQIVVQPQYTFISTCESENDLLKVKRLCFIESEQKKEELIGIINAQGKTIIGTKYRWIMPSDDEKHFTIQRTDYSYGLVNLYGYEIPEFNKFLYIGQMVKQFVRVRKDGWAVADINGNVIIKGGIFERIWDLNPIYETIVVEKAGIRYSISFELLRQLKKEFDENGKIITSVEAIMKYQSYLQGDFSGEKLSATLADLFA